MGAADVAVGGAVLLALACQGAGGAPASGAAPARGVVQAPVTASAAAPGDPPEVEHPQLFLVGQSPGVEPPIVFDNRAFLKIYGNWIAIEGDRLRAAPEYRVGIAGTGLFDATGSLPEQAWVLTARDRHPNPPLRWTPAGWQAISGADDLPNFRIGNVALCRWSGRHLLLRSQRDADGTTGRSSFQLLDASTRPPEFARAEPAVSARCETRLVAESCFPMSDGGLVVLGPACGVGRTQALEYFGPKAATGIPLELARGRRQQIWISSGSSNDAALYLGGWLGDEEAPYLARIAAGGRIEELQVPGGIDAIQRVAADSDGSVWLDAPLQGQKGNLDGDSLWRRSASGGWTRAHIESRVPDKPDMGVTCCGFGLFSAAGSVWFEAIYVRAGAAAGEDDAMKLLYRNRPVAEKSWPNAQ
jgi:hypothetical protein